MITKEWCILDLPWDQSWRFSKCGDEGSIVLNYRCRIAGFLYGGGTSKSAGKDITYITPIEWLLEDIEKTLGVTVHFS